MEVQITFYIERYEDEIELFIVGDVEPGCPPKLSGHPDTWEPGEGGSSCLEGIFLDEACKVRWTGRLTAEEQEEAEELLEEALEVKLQDLADEAAIDKAEAMMNEPPCFGGYGRYGPDIHDF